MGVEPGLTLENCWVWPTSKKEKGQLGPKVGTRNKEQRCSMALLQGPCEHPVLRASLA